MAMGDDLYGAVLIQARRRRALLDRPDLGALLTAATAARAQSSEPAPRATPPPEPDGLAPLPGAKYRRSTPEQIAAFFGRRPSTIPNRG